MSELIAEARVLVTPDTTKFAALLETQLVAITKAVPPIPVAITPVVTGASGTAGLVAAQQELGLSTAAVTTSLAEEDVALRSVSRKELESAGASDAAAAAAKAEAAARREAAVAAAAHARALGQSGRGAAATALSFTGLRGATLAATGPFLAGAAGAVAFAKAIQVATGFNQQLSVFAATTGATADEMERVSLAAQALGKDLTLPGVSASDAAEAMTEFAKAGLSVNDAIAATRGGLQLATAAQLSNADAVELTASALNAFKQSGDQAVSVADTLANAANAAQGSISDIGLGLKQASGAAAAVGVSFQDTVALLTLLAKNGLTASDAGTALRTSFIRLINPSVKAREILKDLNVNLRDAQGNLRPEVFKEFADAQKDLAVSTQQANAAIVFGQDAFRVIGLLGRENADSLDKTRVALDQTGTAAKVAGARMVGLAGASANLSNQLEALGLTIGQVVSGPMTNLTKGLADMVGFLNVGATASVKFFKTFGTFDASNAHLDDLIAQLDKVTKEQKKFSETGGFTSPGLTKDAAALQQQLIELGKSFRDLGPQGVQKFVDAFTTASPQIRQAMQDNVITPLENAQLSTTALGRAFLSGLPRTAFVGLGAAVRSGIEDATAAAKVGVADLGAEVHSGIEDAARGAVAATAAFEDVGPAIQRHLKVASAAALSGLSLAVARAQGNQGSELSILRQQEQRQQDFLNAVLGRDQTPKNVELAKKAAQNLETTRSAIKAILDQRKSVAKQLADQAAATAKAEASAADQAFLQRQEDARTRQERLVSQAGDTPALADDIRRQVQLRVLIKKQIAALKDSAVDEKTKQAALHALRLARDATADELTRLRNQQKASLAQQRQDALEQIGANLALRTQIAEARDAGTAVIVKRLDAEIANQKKVVARARKAHKGVLEAILELETLRQKKRDLLNQQKKDAAADSGFNAFQFLQQTQGFAANLLGNLIPGFATGGLVGNTSAAAGQRAGASMEDLAATVPGVAAPKDRGVRPVQVDTTNSLLRQILAALHGRQTKPPEARQNWRTAFAELDTL